MNIGIFDSGSGGLHILNALQKSHPAYSYVYLADSAFGSYGNATHTSILAQSESALYFLRSQKCTLIIIACNSASSEALRILQHKYSSEDFSILGILIPTAEVAICTAKNTLIGLLGTTATISSGAYQRELTKLNPSAKTVLSASPNLARLIEQHATQDEINNALDFALEPFKNSSPGVLILGCTHYEYIRDMIAHKLPHTKIITTGPIISKKLSNYFKNHPNIEQALSTSSCITFFNTSDSADFRAHVSNTFQDSNIIHHAVLTHPDNLL